MHSLVDLSPSFGNPQLSLHAFFNALQHPQREYLQHQLLSLFDVGLQ